MRKLFAAVAALALVGCAGTREARTEDRRERLTQAGMTNDQSNQTNDQMDVGNEDDALGSDDLDDDQRFDEPGMGGSGTEGAGDAGVETDQGTPSTEDFGTGGSGTQDDLGTGGAGMGEDDTGAGMDGELGTGGSGSDMGTGGTGTSGSGNMGTGTTGSGTGSDLGTGGTGGSGTDGSMTTTDEERREGSDIDSRRQPLRQGSTTIQGQPLPDQE